MRLFSALSPRAAGADVGTAVDRVTAHYVGPTADPSTFPIASPWSSSSNLQRLVFQDIFGSNLPINTRAAAMRLSAVARARNLLVSTIAGFPLVAMRRDERLDPTPTWLTTAGGGSTPQHRIAYTVDDLIFYGWSCWWRRNGADGFPIAAGRLNQGDWTINEDNRVEVHGQVVDDDQVIVIPGFHEGILSYGVDVLDDARTLHRNVRQRIANPVPQLELHQTGGEQLTDEEIDALVARWATARAGQNGGVGYTNEVIELKEHGAGDAQLMIEARNAAGLELARIVGVHAGLIDATAPKASLNYETASGRNQEFVDFDLPLYMSPIVARLSLDDCTPHGQRVTFDVGEFTTPTPTRTGPALED